MKIEESLEALYRLREDPSSPGARAEIRKHLAAKSNLVVAKAAKIIADFELSDFEPALVEVFGRFMRNAATTDKGCLAKTETVKALYTLGAAEGDVFLAGIRHVQMEPSWGKPVDTAAPLRTASAFGLVRMNHPDAIDEIVTLLVDREPDARIGAVRALAYSGRPEAAALVRLKALQGDESADVKFECFAALLALAPEKSLAFVAGYLDGDDPALADAAAMTLGQSRLEAAVTILIKKFQAGAAGPLRPALLTSMAFARIECALDFLFDLIRSGSEPAAVQAVTALAMYRHDDRIREQVESLVQQRDTRMLTDALDRDFHGRP
ncbi:MAG TPA: HEAT repeat domain-containing protein [Bryobacteraceae bacterium]|nr:HEAT repeat domain-containing protein [Bryobacteraceae bacterium]